jgi:hypothetical protein
VPDLRDRHDPGDIVDVEEDPVVSDAEAIESVFALELCDTRRKDILLEAIDAGSKLPLTALGE